MHKFLFYNKFIIFLYMFRALLCSSSWGQNCIIQHLVSSHSVGGHPVCRWERTPTMLPAGSQPAASSVHYTTNCKHSLLLLKMGESVARNMLSWLKFLITVIVASSWLFILFHTVLSVLYHYFIDQKLLHIHVLSLKIPSSRSDISCVKRLSNTLVYCL